MDVFFNEGMFIEFQDQVFTKFAYTIGFTCIGCGRNIKKTRKVQSATLNQQKMIEEVTKASCGYHDKSHNSEFRILHQSVRRIDVHMHGREDVKASINSNSPTWKIRVC